MKTPMIVTCSSDRGLCGGIHSSLAKATKKVLALNKESRVAILGIKARSKVQHDYSAQIALSFDGVCKFPPTWLEASSIAEVILQQKAHSKTDGFHVIYNCFKSVIAFETSAIKIPTLETIAAARKNVY